MQYFLKPSKMNRPPPSKQRAAADKVSDTMKMRPPADPVKTRGGGVGLGFPPRKHSSNNNSKVKLLTAATTNSDGISCCNNNNQIKKLTKLLLNVNVQNGLGPLQVVMSPENTVEELIMAAISLYVKEKRRPLLASSNPTCFQLHYSQFSLQRLRQDEKLMNLGSRNFFLCTAKPSSNKEDDDDVAEYGNRSSSSSSSCSDEVNALMAQLPPCFPATKFMAFLL